MPDTRLIRRVQFVASHFFVGNQTGDLGYEHHHVYTVTLKVRSHEDSPMDLNELDRLIALEIVSPMERACINQLDSTLAKFPTTEAIANFLGRKMFDKLGSKLLSLSVSESPDLKSEVIFE